MVTVGARRAAFVSRRDSNSIAAEAGLHFFQEHGQQLETYETDPAGGYSLSFDRDLVYPLQPARFFGEETRLIEAAPN